jgi:hypothetical protein
MDKKATIDSLITNGGWAEADREWLNQQEEKRLERLAKLKETAPTTNAITQAVQTGAAGVAPAVTTPAVAVTNATPPQKTPEQLLAEYVTNAPQPIREVLEYGLAEHAAKRANLIKVITENKANRFTPDYLNGMKLEALEAIAALAQTAPAQNIGILPAPTNFGLNGGAPLTSNAAAADALPKLAAPVLNFATKQ